MKSVWEMLQELEDLRDSGEIGNEWEVSFIASNFRRIKSFHGNTESLSEKQVDKIQQLWERHCA